MSDMSSTSGYMGAKYVQEFGPISFDMSSASGYMSAKYVQELGPRFSACLTNGSGSEYIQFVIPWDIQSIRGGIVHEHPSKNSFLTLFGTRYYNIMICLTTLCGSHFLWKSVKK